MGPATLGSQNLLVSDLLHPENGQWNRELLQWFLPFEEERVLLLQPSSKGAKDTQKWLGTKDGIYSVKSGYHTAMEEITAELLENEATQEFDWRKAVWSLKLAPKIKLFTWKSLKGILPVGERLNARHIPTEASCKRCGSLESINHLLLHCPFAREVWNLAPLAGSFEVSGLTDLRADWTELHVAKSLPPAGITSTPLVPWILWFLWKARNKFVFENFAGNPAATLSQAIVAAREWELAQVPVGGNLPTRSPMEATRLEVVVQSDASWEKASLSAGLGWQIVTKERTRRVSKSEHFAASVLVAEGLALRSAVEDCCSLGMKEVSFESDSTQLIRAINEKNPVLELYGIVEDIIWMVKEFDAVVFVWIPHLKNGVADLLARNAMNVVGSVVVEDLIPPPV